MRKNSTYLGGSTGSFYGDAGSGIALDSSGFVHIDGDAASFDFPVVGNNYQDTNSTNGKRFVAMLDFTQSGLASLVWSTFLGGTNGAQGDVPSGIALDANGNTFLTGWTSSTDFPTTLDAVQTTSLGTGFNPFLAELDSTGSNLLYGTFFGGSCTNGDSGTGVAVSINGNAYITGMTCSTDFPVLNAYQTSLAGTYNSFIAKFAFAPGPGPGITLSISPSPNANGWNSSPVTVRFICIPGAAPIQSCPSATSVNSGGANQKVSGTVIDTSFNTAQKSVIVNLDMAPPNLTISSPSNGATVSSPALIVTGKVSDELSGVVGVNCNNVRATISGSSFSCSLPLATGFNSIDVVGTDLAGNSTAITLTVTLPHRKWSPPRRRPIW